MSIIAHFAVLYKKAEASFCGDFDLKHFQRFMLDTEIYVDRIADMRVNDMNAVVEAVRQMALMK